MCPTDPFKRLFRYLNALEHILSRNTRLRNVVNSSKEVNLIINLVAKKSKNPNTIRTLQRQYEIGDAHHSKNDQRVGLCYLFLLKYSPPDSIFSLIENLSDRVHRCQSAQRQAFNLLVEDAVNAFESFAGREDETKTKYDDLIPQPGSLPEKILDSGNNGGDPKDFILTCVEHWLDDFKMSAYTSAFLEPARYYFHVTSNHHHRDHVNVHGLNGFIAIINGWFEMEIPIVPMLNDHDAFKGCADIWRGLSDDCWKVFADPQNFGKSFEGIRGLSDSMITDRKFSSFDSGKSFCGQNANTMLANAKKRKTKLKLYADKFAHFFRPDYMVKKMFENLNAESRVNYLGYRAASEKLFDIYKLQFRQIDPSSSFLEYFYDDMMTTLDLNKATHWFSWIGVIKPTACVGPRGRVVTQNRTSGRAELSPCGKCGSAAVVPGKFCAHCGERILANWPRASSTASKKKKTSKVHPAETRMKVEGIVSRAFRDIDDAEEDGEENVGDYFVIVNKEGVDEKPPQLKNDLDDADSDLFNPNYCPICFEEKDDVEILPHMHAKGDISTHRMCGECRVSFHKTTCPFCSEIIAKDELLEVIETFVKSIESATSADVHAQAALLERWQFFELEYQSNPAIIKRVAKLIIQDKGFKKLLEDGVRNQRAWLRDAAGIILRFHTFTGNFDITPVEKKLLADAYNVILRLVKSMEVSGHHFGALYSQAIICFLAAIQQQARNEEEINKLGKVVREIGKLIVQRACERGGQSLQQVKREVPERLYKDYVYSCSHALWGGTDKDVVLKQFFV